ncbi:MAG: class I SAM-dependent methyltransferase [Gammaproteobacteria bacterium]|nr:class I SAM-dependent methyltransferase [Gammaproteobacteria bacterium]
MHMNTKIATCTKSNKENFSWIVDDKGLALQLVSDKKLKPLRVDFSSTIITHRRKTVSPKQSIAKAIGIKGNYYPSILDATAGLGRDAFILATLGCEVTLIEKHPIIAKLLKDGLERASKIHDLAIIVQKMNLIEGDAIQYMRKLEKKPDVVYLDPMFPERKKSAKVKKEMQILQALLREEDKKEDGEVIQRNLSALFNAALKTAKKRVVVKRPKLVAPILNQKPDIQFIGKTCRFDVYLNLGKRI